MVADLRPEEGSVHSGTDFTLFTQAEDAHVPIAKEPPQVVLVHLNLLEVFKVMKLLLALLGFQILQD